MVYWYNPLVKKNQCKKFAKFNEGPYRVIELLIPVTLRLELHKNPPQSRIVHIEDVAKAEKRMDTLTNPGADNSVNKNFEPDDNCKNCDTINNDNLEEESLGRNFFEVGRFVQIPQSRYKLRPRIDGRVVRD